MKQSAQDQRAYELDVIDNKHNMSEREHRGSLTSHRQKQKGTKGKEGTFY